MSANLHIRFVYPQDKTKMKFALITFDKALTKEQLEEIKAGFLELRSCGDVDLSPMRISMIVNADFGGPHEQSFVEDLEKYAREHYDVKGVIHDKR